MQKKNRREQPKRNRVKVHASLFEQLEKKIETQNKLSAYTMDVSELLKRIWNAPVDPNVQFDYIPFQGSFKLDTSVLPVFEYADPIDIHFPAYDFVKNSRAGILQKKIEALKAQFKATRSFNLILEIKKHLVEIQALALRLLNKGRKYIVDLKDYIRYCFKPDRTRFFRRLVQLLFKNMDDESGDTAPVFASITGADFFTIQKHPDGFQRKIVDRLDRSDQQ